MRDSTKVIIPIPRKRNQQCKVKINGVEVTKRVVTSSWNLPVTEGIGTFSIRLSNAFGQLTDSYSNGNSAIFYADNTDGTTIQFYGIIDSIKDNISKDGQFLDIEGRHRSYLLTEFLVCHSATSTVTSQILKDIIDKLPTSYGFTYINVSTTTDSMDVEWNYKPFWDCVVELSNYAEYDCYVDNDLDFHYFEENSILNENDILAEGSNFLNSRSVGTDSYYEKTRVTVVGQDENGLPIIYTAIDPDEGDDIKEIVIKDSSANTETKVQNLAESKLEEITSTVPQAVINSFGLENAKPGDNLQVLIPRHKFNGQYKVMQITHKFGMEVGGWRTETTIEKEEIGTSEIIRKVSQKSDRITGIDNVNKLKYSFNFSFSDDDKTASHETTEISSGKLVISSDSATEGTWISTLKTHSEDLTNVEMRFKGTNIGSSEFYYSLDGGSSYEQIENFSTLITPTETVGKAIKIKIILKRPSGSTLNPEIDSMVLLYS